MRILLISHGLPPDSIGGVEQHVDGLARALAADGHTVEIFARAALPDLPQGRWLCTAPGNPRITRVAYRWQGVDSLDATYHCPPMAESLRAFLAERRAAGAEFDVAHVHHLTGMSSDALATLGTRAVNQLPVVEGARLVGLLTREDVLKWLSLHDSTRRPSQSLR